MSSADVAAQSVDVSWRGALDCIAVEGRCLSAQEVSDFCSVLFLAERVHVRGRGGSDPAANLLATQLATLGYPVHGVDRLRTVEPTDTVVTICGPDPHDRQFLPDRLLRPVTESGAVLLAIAADDCSALLTLADAAIAIPLPRPRRGARDRHLARVAFDLLVSLTVDVVRRDLARRITSNGYPTTGRTMDRTTDHQPLAAGDATFNIPGFNTPGTDEARIIRLDPHRPVRRCTADGRNWS